MRIKTILLSLLCVGAILFASSVQAAPRKKKPGNGGANMSTFVAPPPPVGSLAAEAAPTINPADLPSVSLQPFLDTHLGKILAPLDVPGLDQPELIASLKAAYADGLTAAPAARKPAYQAAQNVCDAMASAMNERQTAVSALRGATATRTSETQQPRGAGGQAKTEAQNSDNFFIGGQKNNWVQRAAVLRQNIMGIYLREREFERQAAAKAPAPTPSPTAR